MRCDDRIFYMAFDSLKIREKFLPLNQKINGKLPIYLDNACVTLRPVSVVNAMAEYYNVFPGCHGRSLHYFGEKTSKFYNLARQSIRRFINARWPEEIIFTRNATEGINILSNIIPFNNKAVLISELEHNSNLLPWQALKRKKGVELSIFKLNKDLTFSAERFKEKLNSSIGVVSIPHMSNVTGVVYPIREIAKLVHENGALLIVDGAQAVSSNQVDAQKDDVDFYVFSAHKMYGPSGIGCLYGKRELLEKYPPFLVGGETVTDSRFDSSTISALPDKYEAGLQDYAGAIGFGAAVSFIEKAGLQNIKDCITRLNSRLSDELADDKDINLIGPRNPSLRNSIFNFYIDGIDPFMLTGILNRSRNIMARCGKHCAHSWYNENKIPDSIRVSFGVYNTIEEIDILVREIKNIIRCYKK